MKGLLANQPGQECSFCRRQTFRIRDPCPEKTGDGGLKNDTGGNHWPGKSPAPDLVDSRNKAGRPVRPKKRILPGAIWTRGGR